MKISKLLVALLLLLAAVLVILYKLGLLWGGVGNDPAYLSSEEIRAIYKQAAEENSQRRRAKEQATANDLRDSFVRSLAEYDASSSWIASHLAEGEAICTQEDLDAWTAELVPVIEQVTGWSYALEPVVKLADREMLVVSLWQDLNLTMFGGSSNTSESAKLMVALQSAMLLGNFGMHTREVYVVATNFRPLLAEMDLSSTEYEALAKLVLAHELVHALQDQVVSLRSQSMVALEERFAAHAAIEGHATLIEQLVAEELGLGAHSAQLFEIITGGIASKFSKDSPEVAEQFFADQAFTYRAGRDFMAHHLEVGGHDRLRTILISPPRSEQTIMMPARWEHAARSLPADLLPDEIEEIVEAVGVRRTDDPDRPQQFFNQIVSRMRGEARTLIADEYDGGIVGVFLPEGRRGWVVIVAHRFRSAARASRWRDAAPMTARKLRDHRLTQDGAEVREYAETPLDHLPSPGGLRVRYIDFIEGRGGALVDESFSAIDQMAVQVYIHNVEVDSAFHQRVHDAMHRHYQVRVSGAQVDVEGGSDTKRGDAPSDSD